MPVAEKEVVAADTLPGTVQPAEVKPADDNGLGLGNFINELTPKSAEPKAEEPKVVEAASEPTESKDKQAPAGSTAASVPGDAVATKDSPKTDKESESIAKQLAAQAKANLRLGTENAELKRTLARVEAKLDGTYKEPDAPSTEVLVSDAEKRGLIVASHHAAVELHGEEFVQATVWADDSPYQELIKQDPSIQERVMASKAPVLAAIKEVKKAEASVKYGKDPEEIRKNMEAELTEKITKDVLAKFTTPPGMPVKGLGEVRGTERTEMKNGPPAEVDFKSIFPIGGYG